MQLLDCLKGITVSQFYMRQVVRSEKKSRNEYRTINFWSRNIKQYYFQYLRWDRLSLYIDRSTICNLMQISDIIKIMRVSKVVTGDDLKHIFEVSIHIKIRGGNFLHLCKRSRNTLITP